MTSRATRGTAKWSGPRNQLLLTLGRICPGDMGRDTVERASRGKGVRSRPECLKLPLQHFSVFVASTTKESNPGSATIVLDSAHTLGWKPLLQWVCITGSIPVNSLAFQDCPSEWWYTRDNPTLLQWLPAHTQDTSHNVVLARTA